jgi:CheY-like chemotaxis protein
VKRLILVSDGNPTVAQTLSQIGENLEVTILADPASTVIERARKDQPDLIILDIQQQDGLELLSLLKTGMGTRTIPVVVVAAEDSTLRDMALEIGADAFVAKPLGPDFLPKVITFLSMQKKPHKK